jgi:hypothetical protein
MPFYTFHIFRENCAPTALDMVELPDDGATFLRSGELLDEHPTCDYVEVWDGERAVVARYRDQPIIRPVETAGASC